MFPIYRFQIALILLKYYLTFDLSNIPLIPIYSPIKVEREREKTTIHHKMDVETNRGVRKKRKKNISCNFVLNQNQCLANQLNNRAWTCKFQV